MEKKGFKLHAAFNAVIDWKIKVFEVKDSKNGDYKIMKGSVGAVRNEEGKYEGGMLVDVILPADMTYEENEYGMYFVSGQIRWSINEDCHGIRHNNCTIWADKVRPYKIERK